MQWVEESETGYFSGERRDEALRALDRTEKLAEQLEAASQRTMKLGEWCLELAQHLGTLTEQMLKMEARITELEKTKPGEWEQPNFEAETVCADVTSLCHCFSTGSTSASASGICGLPPNHSGAHHCGVCGMTWDDPGVEETP